MHVLVTGPIFVSQGRSKGEVSFLWNGAVVTDPDQRRQAFGTVSIARRWRTLLRVDPVELLCAKEPLPSVNYALGIQVRTDTLDDGGRHLRVEGLWGGWWTLPTPEEGAAFLEMTMEALVASERSFDVTRVQEALTAIRAGWRSIAWPWGLDVLGSLRGRTRVGRDE